MRGSVSRGSGRGYVGVARGRPIRLRLFDFKPTKLSGSHVGDDKTERFGGPLYSAELVC